MSNSEKTEPSSVGRAMTAPETIETKSGEGADAQASGGVWSPGGVAWGLFEFGRNPFFLLVVIFLFAPYYAQNVAGGGAQGQAAVAGVTKWAGVITAITAPLLGALVDRGGRRKPLMALFIGVLAVCAALLWYAKPGAGGLGVGGTALVLVVAYVAYAYSEVLHNAMLPLAGRKRSLSAISGIGLAMGSGASVMLFVFLLWAFSIPAAGVQMPGVPDAPLFGVDPAAFEPQRLVGPLTAVWMVVFVIPFFIFLPDGVRQGGSWRMAAVDMWGRDDKGALLGPVARARGLISYGRKLFADSPEVMKYLLARMIYADGVSVVMSLGAVYVATFFGWTLIELALYAIFATLFAAIGGVVGALLDRWLGARRAIITSLVMIMIAFLLQLSITQDALFFGLMRAGEDLWAAPVFNSRPDMVFLGLGCLISTFVAACISSSRSMLVLIAPQARMGEFFGLYAVVGTITVWLGPLLVETLTRMTGDQRIGMGSAGLLFVAGLALLLRVRADGRAA